MEMLLPGMNLLCLAGLRSTTNEMRSGPLSVQPCHELKEVQVSFAVRSVVHALVGCTAQCRGQASLSVVGELEINALRSVKLHCLTLHGACNPGALLNNDSIPTLISTTPSSDQTLLRGFVGNSEYKVVHKPHRAQLLCTLTDKFHAERRGATRSRIIHPASLRTSRYETR